MVSSRTRRGQPTRRRFRALERRRRRSSAGPADCARALSCCASFAAICPSGRRSCAGLDALDRTQVGAEAEARRASTRASRSSSAIRRCGAGRRSRCRSRSRAAGRRRPGGRPGPCSEPGRRARIRRTSAAPAASSLPLRSARASKSAFSSSVATRSRRYARSVSGMPAARAGAASAPPPAPASASSAPRLSSSFRGNTEAYPDTGRDFTCSSDSVCLGKAKGRRRASPSFVDRRLSATGSPAPSRRSARRCPRSRPACPARRRPRASRAASSRGGPAGGRRRSACGR